jgi:hypothetical protein
MRDKEYELWMAALKSVPGFFPDYHFGTNEGWEDETMAEMLESISAVDVSTSEANVLEFYVPNIATWGFGQFPDNLLENIDSEDETPEVKAYFHYVGML